MTATPDPTGTAVAVRESLGVLPPQYEAALAVRKREAMMFAEVAKQSWGEKLDQTQRRAIAAFCQRNSLDPSMIDLLGGKLYRNANFWLDRLAKMVGLGRVVYAFADYITADPRLDTIAADKTDPERAQAARIERNRRQDERIKWQVPEEALAACVFRVKLRRADGTEMEEVAGCKPVMAAANDPVGKGNPVMTAETRSARRALRKIIELAPEVAQIYETVEVDWKALAAQVVIGDTEEDPDRPQRHVLPGGAGFRGAGARVTPLASHGDGYTPPETTTGPTPPAPVRAREPGEEDEDEDDGPRLL